MVLFAFTIYVVCERQKFEFVTETDFLNIGRFEFLIVNVPEFNYFSIFWDWTLWVFCQSIGKNR